MEWIRGPVIGRGSSATVSTAKSTVTGQILAVKTADLSQADSLIKEQQFLSTLDCPQIVPYKGHHISKENGKLLYNLFLEYAPNGTVLDEIHRYNRGLPEAKIRSYTRQILLGLNYLHSNGMVHRDMKPGNVLITDSGLKIADLGCAKRVDDDVSCSDSWIAGTPIYMAPEVPRGEEQSFPSDIWAFGCTVVEMFTGKAPWTGEVSDQVSALFKIGFSDNTPEIPSYLSEEAKDFLGKCLKRRPSERWSAGKLLEHDFVTERSNLVVKGWNSETPTSVLNQNFWDSMVEAEETQNLTGNCSPSNSPAERIRRLSCNNPLPTWEFDERWMTVRIKDPVRNIITMEVQLERNFVDVDYLYPTCKSTYISAPYRDLDVLNNRILYYLNFPRPLVVLYLFR